MRTILRQVLVLLFAILAGGYTSALAQAPPPVPALPDAPRLTAYSISASTCTCSVNFALYGEGSDVDNWIDVFIGSTSYLSTDPVFGWSLTSATGPIANIPRPITNAVLTFAMPQSGAVTIVGARRPRRLTQFVESRGVTARELNETFTDLTAVNRETWDRFLTTLRVPGPETVIPLPNAVTRANKFLFFDGGGQPTVTATAPPAPIVGNIIELLDASPLAPIIASICNSTTCPDSVTPVNGFWASGSGAIFTNCPLAGCLEGDHLRSAFYLKASAALDASIEEFLVNFDCNLNSGKTGTAIGPGGESSNKVCLAISSVTGSNSGNSSWGMANNLIVKAGDTGTFKVGAEFDIQNNGADCAVGAGGRNCYNLYVSGNAGLNPITAEIAIAPQVIAGSAPNAAHYGLLINGAHVADNVDIENSGGAPIGICNGCLLSVTHSQAGFQDNSTTPFGIVLAGNYSNTGLILNGTFPDNVMLAPGFRLTNVGNVALLNTSAPDGAFPAVVMTTAGIGIYVSTGTPFSSATDGSIDLDMTGKFWVHRGGVWASVTIP